MLQRFSSPAQTNRHAGRRTEERLKEIFDDFLWTKENKIITRDKHGVPGLANFGHWNYRSATTPAETHYHTGIYEIHAMVHGRRVFHILEGEQQRTYIVNGNQAAITFPGQPHGYNDSFVEPYEFYSIQLDVKNPSCLLGLDKAYSKELFREMQDLQRRLQAEGEHLLHLGSTHLQLLRSAFNFFSSFEEDSVKTGVQFLCAFFFTLKYLKPPANERVMDENIARCLDYIHDHYLDNPPLQDLAMVSGYSLSYFKMKFKNELGTTPADYITLQRLEYAKDRLANSNASITRIALDMGYSSSSYFCAQFKRLTSYSPNAYREKYSD